ncbi:MAG: pyridoxal phosphate-dependent aminotransferase [Candidatus Diapherotrites archaeon]
MKPLSTRVSAIAPSATFAINNKANEMIAKGINVLKFGTGEPDYNTPENVKAAAKKAIDENKSKYTASTGIPELKKAIAEKFRKENGLDYSVKEVIACNGAKQALFGAFFALLNEGDEVILPKPAWVSFKEQIQIAGGRVKWVETDENFKLHAETVAKAITPKTKAILINSPNNPTGAVFEEKEVRKIAELAIENDFFIISDECYEYFIYSGKKQFSPATISEEAKARTITINAVSKSYAMTGWRLGYAAGPQKIISLMGNLQDHSTSNPSNPAQYAAIEALNGPKKDLHEMVSEFKKRRDATVKGLNEIDGFDCPMPEGAFYAFPRVNSLYGEKINGSDEMCNFLLEEAHVALVSGKAFEADDCIRFSYASSMQSIVEGLERIKSAAAKLK